MKNLCVWLVAVFFALSARGQVRPQADLVITHAKVWTVDREHPTAEAVAVLGDRIVAAGTNAEIEAWRGPATHVIDAKGKLLLPGFNDSHVHFQDGSFQLTSVQLNDATSVAEFVRRVRDYAGKMRKGEWMQGGEWDETRWTPADLPTKEMIDPFTAGIPVFIERYDGHSSLANSAALKIAGVTAQTPDPPGGVIVRDAKGNPTGVVKDAAADLVAKFIPPHSHEQEMAAIRGGLKYAASLGVTSAQHMDPDYADIAAYAELQERGELTTRIYAAPLITQVEDQAKIGIRRAFGSSYLRMGAVKAFADGSLGSHTAYFFEPFADQPENHGLLADEMQPLALMRERMMKADAAGLQVCAHAIGDRAISMILDLYSEIVAAHGEADRRFRIEHAQHMAEKDFDRFARLHVIASMQPYHAIDDGRWAETRTGPERAKLSYAWRSFLDHGVRLAFGTDWPVAPLDPILGIYAAATRATLDGKNPEGWIPQQKITVAEAVEAYTLGSAYAEFQEREKGSIAPGKLADMVLLSDDIFTLPAERIRDVKVVMTLVGGKLVWDSGKQGNGPRS